MRSCDASTATRSSSPIWTSQLPRNRGRRQSGPSRLRQEPREDLGVSSCLQSPGTRGSEVESAGEDADEELRRSGEDEVGLLGGARVGVDGALAGFDGDYLLAG